MQSITKFKADDGTEFYDKGECLAHESLCAQVASVMAELPALPKDDGCKFSNGHGYIQHDPLVFWVAREKLLRLAAPICKHKWIDDAIARPTEIHPSWPHRIISECSAPLSRAWYRFMCVDSLLREWGQPYFANNPTEAEQVCLNQ